MYQSGTVNVENFGPESAKSPWIGIHYRPEGQATDDERMILAARIQSVLNNEIPCDAGFARDSLTTGNWNGLQFSAIGPMIDKRPPTCWWIEDDSMQANIARFHLMDAICGKMVES